MQPKQVIGISAGTGSKPGAASFDALALGPGVLGAGVRAFFRGTLDNCSQTNRAAQLNRQREGWL